MSSNGRSLVLALLNEISDLLVVMDIMSDENAFHGIVFTVSAKPMIAGELECSTSLFIPDDDEVKIDFGGETGREIQELEQPQILGRKDK